MKTNELNNNELNIDELNNDELETLSAGAEPPKYASPEAEKRAKELIKRQRELVNHNYYVESEPGSELLIPNPALVQRG